MTHEFSLGGLKVEIVGREFPDEFEEYWDANWLQVKTDCRDTHARAGHQGPILLTFEIEDFRKQLERVAANETEQAVLDGTEPGLKVFVSRNGASGHFMAAVELSDESQNHIQEFKFDLDETELIAATKQLSRIMKAYPVRQGDQHV
ncbi:hypothetical protein MXMO3_00098 [Maritalea myrionectae]|uniref:Uncharacterized protein n=1 Tax=Maritalea myrionectae TaxID=454601 RepID=A0A2R4M9V5_9HYPH|nr:hypothetical protein [Maritalea myrionectae]AVX02646.1 hypothetical protein MXMO3_00098 [Maritalea myrionectae]